VDRSADLRRPGVVIGGEAVIAAGSVVTGDQPREMRCAGNPCVAIGARWREPQIKDYKIRRFFE